MGDRIKVPIITPEGDSREEIGTIMDIVDLKEPWSEYALEDGTKVRIRQTIVNIVKMDIRDSAGNPVYSIQTQPVISVIPKV